MNSNLFCHHDVLAPSLAPPSLRGKIHVYPIYPPSLRGTSHWAFNPRPGLRIRKAEQLPRVALPAGAIAVSLRRAGEWIVEETPV